ncbi:MAG: tetratricopeptide repeat protein, partial [Deltaproteobacteria bacterium]|nr:tetratricopeptide repeat protein [Deltaproteobacteria bacterium]
MNERRDQDQHPSFPLTEFTASPLPAPSTQMDPKGKAYSEFALFALHSAHGRYEEAERHLERAIEQDPEAVFLLQRMALLLKQQGKNEDALTYARRCVELEPTRIEHHLLEAEIAGLLEREEEAIQAYKKALVLDPDHKRARLVLTTLLIKTKRYDQALRQLDRIIEQDPNLVIAHYYRGRVY